MEKVIYQKNVSFSRFKNVFNIITGIFIFLSLGLEDLSAQNTWKAEVQQYIERNLKKSDGGYGWEDQYDSHITPTYAVIGILHDLDRLPENKQELITFIKTHHPQRQKNKEAGPSGTELRNLVYQQIQSVIWLNGDVSGFKTEVEAWESQAGKLANYESHGYPVLIQEVVKPVCYPLLGLPVTTISQEFETYLNSRQRANGSFNNAPVADGGDGNIINTYWSLLTLKALQIPFAKKTELASWVNACQLSNGGFTHQPDAEIGNTDDVAYSWASIKTLELLGVKPKNLQPCIEYLLSLRNTDGGFGNRPGLPSTPESTFYALNSLKALNALSVLDKALKNNRPVAKKTDFADYKVYTVQFQASGSGSPTEAVMLADSLKINLWGAKNAGVGWIKTAQKIADEKKVPVIFFQSDEPYGKNIMVPGMGEFGHILDYIAPADADLPFKKSVSSKDFRKSSLQIKENSSWQELKKEVIDPLLQNNGGLILQVANNEPMARILLDESIKNGGYKAISTIHFGQNFLFWCPYLNQYRYQLPLVALQDAHGTEAWWWAGELVSYRNLFLAKEPTYKAMHEAMKNNHIVAVRHDRISDFKTRMLGGEANAREYIIAQQNKWKWWDDNQVENIHPWAAITVVHPADSFEVARPQKGVNIRIRCRWDGVRNTIKEPLVDLIQLKINNTVIDAKDIIKKEENEKDSYFLYIIDDIKDGEYVIEATLKHLKDKSVKVVTEKFTYKK